MDTFINPQVAAQFLSGQTGYIATKTAAEIAKALWSPQTQRIYSGRRWSFINRHQILPRLQLQVSEMMQRSRTHPAKLCSCCVFAVTLTTAKFMFTTLTVAATVRHSSLLGCSSSFIIVFIIIIIIIIIVFIERGRCIEGHRHACLTRQRNTHHQAIE